MPQNLLLEIIKKYVAIGENISLSLNDNERIISGELLEINDLGVVIKTENKIRFLRGDKISEFEGSSTSATSPDSTPSNISQIKTDDESLFTDNEKIEEDINHSQISKDIEPESIPRNFSQIETNDECVLVDSKEPTENSSQSQPMKNHDPLDDGNVSSLKNMVKSEADDKQIQSEKKAESPPTDFLYFAFERFKGQPYLTIPEPDFKISDLIKEDQQDINRIKNKYEYAVKIHEFNRIFNILPELIRLAERIRHHKLYLNTGLLSLKIDKTEKATEQLLNSLYFGNRLAPVVLAYIAINSNDWQSAADYIIQSFLNEKDSQPSETELLTALGCCMNQLNFRELKGLAGIQPQIKTKDGRELLNLLIGFALKKKYPEASLAAIKGDIVKASQFALNSNIFSPPSKIVPPFKDTIGFELRHNWGKDKNIVGHISAVYPDRNFGFIISSEQETFFFYFNNIDDLELRGNLQTNRTGHKISFLRDNKQSKDSKYDNAVQIKWIDADKQEFKQTKKRPIALPKGDSLYAKAKLSEQTGELEKAESYFKQVISEKGRYSNSAIKDLAQLLNRKDRGKEAIELLNQYRHVFIDDIKPIDNLKASIFIKLKLYNNAASIFNNLGKKAIGQERDRYIRQEAYCTMMDGNLDNALLLLKKLIKKSPYDQQSLNLIQRIELIKKSGQSDEEELQGVASLSSGLSYFAQELINNCEYRGADERSKVRGFFVKKDFIDVEKNFDRLVGRRPSDKADLLLTLAAMTEKSPESAGRRNTRNLLGRSLAFMGEASTYENCHKDTIRFYLSESLSLISGSDLDIRFPLAFLIASYLFKKPEPGELLYKRGERYEYDLGNILREIEKDEDTAKSFFKDFSYYSTISKAASDILIKEVEKNCSTLINYMPHSKEKREQEFFENLEQQRKERIILRTLSEQNYIIAGNFQETANKLFEIQESTRFELDKQRLLGLANMATDTSAYWQERDYIERESKYARLIYGLNSFNEEIKKNPTKISFELLIPIAESIKESIKKDFQDFTEKAKPILELNNVLSNDYYLPEDDNVITLRLELLSKAGGAPVEGLDFYAHEENGLKLIEPEHSPALLKGGERREIELKIKPSEKQLNDQAFTVRCFIHYRTRLGKQEKSEDFSFPIRIGNSSCFTKIINPYEDYSGGKSVDDPNMFKGRDEVLQRISKIVTEGPIGQCFVLYGQKRSGKTSILHQIKRHFSDNCIPVEITIGAIDINNKQTNFIQLCLDELNEYIEDYLDLKLDNWPPRERIKESPIESFKYAFRELLNRLNSKGFEKPRIILLIDEFTYLFEYIKEGIVSPTFMRNWKALLQMKLFNAVIVGQDSMPKFKNTYPNEFGVTHDERISYLSRKEAYRLAEEPILFEDKSRYRGHALERLFELTAGSPFYMNIICDRLVTHMNSRQAPFITEADVEYVLKDIVSGRNPLSIERFDPLITAAGESVAEAPRDIYIQVLTAIAKKRNSALIRDLPQLSNIEHILKDMHDREVIMLDSGKRYSIRVGLFAEWLRINSALSGVKEDLS